MFNKNFTCCFTGHRQIASEHLEQLPAFIETGIRRMIAQGYFVFAAGGAKGFDTLAAETVLSLKPEFFQLQLVIVAPCADQAQNWQAADKRRYERLCHAADDYICLSATYTADCMKRRNHMLVEMSSACLAYCTRGRSGSSQTLKYAGEQGLEIINFVPFKK